MSISSAPTFSPRDSQEIIASKELMDVYSRLIEKIKYISRKAPDKLDAFVNTLPLHLRSLVPSILDEGRGVTDYINDDPEVADILSEIELEKKGMMGKALDAVRKFDFPEKAMEILKGAIKLPMWIIGRMPLPALALAIAVIGIVGVSGIPYFLSFLETIQGQATLESAAAAIDLPMDQLSKYLPDLGAIFAEVGTPDGLPM